MTNRGRAEKFVDEELCWIDDARTYGIHAVTQLLDAAVDDERAACLFAAACAENNGGSACAAIRARGVK